MPPDHISLDAWNTLITPNPEFSRKRTEAIARTVGISPEKAKASYTTIKTHLDNLSENVGVALPTALAWQHLAVELGFREIAASLQAEIELLFAEFPPIVVPGLVDELQRLKAKNTTLSITSNTNFITGGILRKVVFDAWDVFDFTIFSDEFGFSKPHKGIFNEVLRRVPGNNKMNSKSVIHIGDHVECDIRGAHAVSITPILVDSPNKTVEVLRFF